MPIQASPQSASLAALYELLQKTRSGLNTASVPDIIPLLGGQGLGDLFLGQAPEEIQNWSYGNYPLRIPELSNVPIVKTGRKQPLADTMLLGMDLPIGALGVRAARKMIPSGLNDFPVSGGSWLPGHAVTDQSRRNFLKQTGALAGAGTAAVSVPLAVKHIASVSDSPLSKVDSMAELTAKASNFIDPESVGLVGLAGIVKNKGGTWFPSARQGLMESLESPFKFEINTPMREFNIDPAIWEAMNPGMKRETLMNLTKGDAEKVNDFLAADAAERFAMGPLSKYVMTSMGTAEDPLRTAVGKGLWLTDTPPVVTDYMRNKAAGMREKAGMPAVGKDVNERLWEDITDAGIRPITPEKHKDLFLQPGTSDYPILSHASFEKDPIYLFNGPNATLNQTGLSDLPSHLYDMMSEGRLDPRKLPGMSVEQAYTIAARDIQDAAKNAAVRDEKIANIAKEFYGNRVPDYQTQRLLGFNMHGGLNPDELKHMMSLETCQGNHCLGAGGGRGHGYKDWFPMRDPITGKDWMKGGVQYNEYMDRLLRDPNEIVTTLRSPSGDYIGTINELKGRLKDDPETWAQVIAHKYPDLKGLINEELNAAKEAQPYGFPVHETISDNLSRLFSKDFADELLNTPVPHYLQIKGMNNAALPEKFWPDVEEYLSRNGPYSLKDLMEGDISNFRAPQKFANGGLVWYKDPKGTYMLTEGAA